MKHCPCCNFKTDRNDDMYCAICGARLKTVFDNPHCKACGAELWTNARFCTKCGEMLAFGPTLSAVSETYSEISVSVSAGKSFPPKKHDAASPVRTPSATSVRPAASPAVPPSAPPVKPAVTLVQTVPEIPASMVSPGIHARGGKDDSTVRAIQGKLSAGIITRDEIRELGRQAMDELPERVAHYAPLVGVKCRKITVRNWKTMWGRCCTAKGILDFNCILMMMPPEVIDSVVVHELCHMLQPNHSDKFYAEVLRVYPDYRKWDEWLDDHGSVLDRMEEGYSYHTSRSLGE